MSIVDTNQPLAEAELTARLHFQLRRVVLRSQGQKHTLSKVDAQTFLCSSELLQDNDSKNHHQKRHSFGHTQDGNIVAKPLTGLSH